MVHALPHYIAIQHMINNIIYISTYICKNIYEYEHFKFLFVAFATSVNQCIFDKIIIADSSKAHNLAFYTNLVNQLCWQFLSIMLALCSMFLPPYYAENYAGIIDSSQSLGFSFTYYSFQNFLKFLRTILISAKLPTIFKLIKMKREWLHFVVRFLEEGYVLQGVLRRMVIQQHNVPIQMSNEQ